MKRAWHSCHDRALAQKRRVCGRSAVDNDWARRTIDTRTDDADVPAVAIVRNADLYQNIWPGDFNGDGKTDLLVIDEKNTCVAILPGNGNGTFGEARTVYAGEGITFGAGSDTWDAVGRITMPMARDTFAGVPLTSRNLNATATAVAHDPGSSAERGIS